MKGWYHPCVGWLELVLGVPLALGVLGWRTSKERSNEGKCMYIIGKLVPMRLYVHLLIDRTDRYIGATVDYENCIIRFLYCLNVNASSHVLLM